MIGLPALDTVTTNMPRLGHLALLALGFGAASTVSCTVIFAPRDDVQRCGSADDCDPTGDRRYIAECRFDPDNVDLDTTQVDKICIAAFNRPSCDPDSYSGNSPYFTAIMELAQTSRYSPMGMTCADLGGVIGCPPPAGGGCDPNLEPNADGVCDDPDSETPARNVASAPEGLDYVGQDVRDQFCRSFFCEADFVCDTTDNLCVRCDPDKEYSEGGCGQIYIAGAPSCVYQTGDGLDDSCAAPNGDPGEPTFGVCG